MQKIEILELILASMQNNLQTLINTAHEAREAATNDESKAENKYDTRGLEASYLAGAQAKRAFELQENIRKLAQIKLIDFSKDQVIAMTALVKVKLTGNQFRWLFLLPYAGGVIVDCAGEKIHVLSSESPLTKKLLGCELGDEFTFKTGSATTDYEVLSIL